MSDHDTPHRTPQDPERIRRYLLGRLSHEESDALETHLLHDGRLFELAEAIEDDLIDRYVRGELPADDAKRFERHLLPSRRIGERVDVARALAAWVDRERGGRPVADRPETGGVVVPLFRRTARLAWAAALVAAIAAGALAFEVSRLHERLEDAGTPAGVEHARGEETSSPIAPVPEPVGEPTSASPGTDAPQRIEELERELATAQERIASLESEVEQDPAERVAGVGADDTVPTATLFLAAITRGVAGEKSLSLQNAERAEIFIPIGPRQPSGNVRTTVTRDGTVIWDDPDTEVRTEEGHSMARLVLPRQSLSEGRYQVRLTEAGREEQAVSYPFSIER